MWLKYLQKVSLQLEFISGHLCKWCLKTFAVAAAAWKDNLTIDRTVPSCTEQLYTLPVLLEVLSI